jgi:predicted small lipoprotein YifL
VTFKKSDNNTLHVQFLLGNMDLELLSACGRRGNLYFIDSSHGADLSIRAAHRHCLNRTNKSGPSVYTVSVRFCNGTMVLNPTKQL